MKDPGAHLDTSESRGMSEVMHDVQGANTQLRGRVQELAADLQGADEEVAALEGLQEQLAAELDADEHIKALVDAAVAREHAIQEARNRKVLDLLSSKVRSILVIPYGTTIARSLHSGFCWKCAVGAINIAEIACCGTQMLRRAEPSASEQHVS